MYALRGFKQFSHFDHIPSAVHRLKPGQQILFSIAFLDYARSNHCSQTTSLRRTQDNYDKSFCRHVFRKEAPFFLLSDDDGPRSRLDSTTDHQLQYAHHDVDDRLGEVGQNRVGEVEVQVVPDPLQTAAECVREDHVDFHVVCSRHWICGKINGREEKTLRWK